MGCACVFFHLCAGTCDHLCTCGMLSSVTPNLTFGDRAFYGAWQAPGICRSAHPNSSSGATGSPPFLLESKSGCHDCPMSSLPTQPLVRKFRTLKGRRQIIPHVQVLLNVRYHGGAAVVWTCRRSSVPGTEFWVDSCGGPPDPVPPGPSQSQLDLSDQKYFLLKH